MESRRWRCDDLHPDGSERLPSAPQQQQEDGGGTGRQVWIEEVGDAPGRQDQGQEHLGFEGNVPHGIVRVGFKL